MARRKYDQSILDEIIARDKCVVLERPDTLNYEAVIKFRCGGCDETHQKVLGSMFNKGGAFCRECTSKRKLQKRSQTIAQQYGESSTAVLLKNMKTQFDNSQQIFVKQSDGVRYPVNREDTVSLVLYPGRTTPVCKGPVSKSAKFSHIKYFDVSYWDFDAPCTKSKSFRIAGESEEDMKTAQEAAQLFRDEQLAVTEANKNRVYTVTIDQILEKQLWYQKYFRIELPVVQYEEQPVPIPPYIFGVWLGDGHSRAPTITNIDPEIIQEFKDYAAGVNLRVRQGGTNNISYSTSSVDGDGVNQFRIALRELDVFGPGMKRIPDVYMHNSLHVRQEVLAGLIDTDGFYAKNADGTGGCYDMVQANERLFDDIRKLVHSLGLTMPKSACIKTCMSDGNKVECQAFRGCIGGKGERLLNLRMRLPRKRFKLGEKRNRMDLISFQLEADSDPSSSA